MPTGLPREAILLRQQVNLAIGMVKAALARKESRGAHWRLDFPYRRPDWDAVQRAAQAGVTTGRGDFRAH